MIMKQIICYVVALLFTTVGTTEIHAQMGLKYPYVQDGKIIVSRDSRGGVKTTCLHPKWTVSPIGYNELSEHNRVAAKFEVYASDNTSTPSAWGSEDGNCPTGWRRPTQRELALIYVLNDKLTAKLRLGYYWTSTTLSQGEEFAFTVILQGTVSEDVVMGIYKTATAHVRCIRDID